MLCFLNKPFSRFQWDAAAAGCDTELAGWIVVIDFHCKRVGLITEFQDHSITRTSVRAKLHKIGLACERLINLRHLCLSVA